VKGNGRVLSMRSFPGPCLKGLWKVWWTRARTSVFRPRFEVSPSGIEVRSGLLERKLARCRQDHNDYAIAAITFTSLIRRCLFSKSSVASRICASRDWAHIIWTISTYLRVLWGSTAEIPTPSLPGTRGGFTVKLIKPELQALSIARAPSKVLGRALQCPKTLELIYERNLLEFYPFWWRFLNFMWHQKRVVKLKRIPS
jgi:hypothetical protein